MHRRGRPVAAPRDQPVGGQIGLGHLGSSGLIVATTPAGPDPLDLGARLAGQIHGGLELGIKLERDVQHAQWPVLRPRVGTGGSVRCSIDSRGGGQSWVKPASADPGGSALRLQEALPRVLELVRLDLLFLW